MKARISRLLRDWLHIGRSAEAVATPVAPAPHRERQSTDHVILLDGTLGDLSPGRETNVGRMYKLLQQAARHRRIALYYEAGVQWRMWSDTADVAMGRTINRQICQAYGWLASKYRPGDRIFLFGYSRGAYAVRSLAGIIDQVGLLRAACATERNVQRAFRHYQSAEVTKAERAFIADHCLPRVEIELIGVFDTVKALGVRLPFLWMWTEPQHEFHNHALSSVVRHGFHALALDENRAAFDPVLWETGAGGWNGRIEQVWFRGAHGDVGGQLSGFEPARPLSNIPLVWMLERAERFGLPLPPDWRETLATDPQAPSIGTTRGWGKAFLLRARRRVGRDPSESIHPSAQGSAAARYWLRHAPGLGSSGQADALPGALPDPASPGA